MSFVVIDASVVFQVLVDERYTSQARALVAKVERGDDEIVAPQLLFFEVTNVIRKRLRRDRLPIGFGLQLLDDLLALPIVPLDPPGLHHRALALAHAHNLGGHDAH